MFVIQRKTSLREFLQKSNVGLLWVSKEDATEFPTKGDANFVLKALMIASYAMVVAK